MSIDDEVADIAAFVAPLKPHLAANAELEQQAQALAERAAEIRKKLFAWLSLPDRIEAVLVTVCQESKRSKQNLFADVFDGHQ